MRREQTPASGWRVREQPSWLRWVLLLYPSGCVTVMRLRITYHGRWSVE